MAWNDPASNKNIEHSVVVDISGGDSARAHRKIWQCIWVGQTKMTVAIVEPELGTIVVRACRQSLSRFR